MQKAGVLIVAISLCVVVGAAHAAPLIYRGNNPRITPTANPYNAANVQAIADLNRPKQRQEATPELSDAETIRRGVLAGISSRIQQEILGSDGPGSGSVNFGDGSRADYSTADGIRTVTFFNADGTTTTISFPL